ncbi:MAG: TrbC/VirB2 family protein [Endomicrobium sp.]|jgi:type IV secretory pathway VirB2 component (pilin)|nr:TrbC/VirB2 family protein [Endomicrobium sp.]
MKIQKSELAALAAVISLAVFAQDSLAQQYGENIKSSLDNLITWVTTVVGGAAVVGGIVWTGIRMSMGDEHAIKNGLKVILGGILIFSAKWILDLLQNVFKAS